MSTPLEAPGEELYVRAVQAICDAAAAVVPTGMEGLSYETIIQALETVPMDEPVLVRRDLLVTLLHHLAYLHHLSAEGYWLSPEVVRRSPSALHPTAYGPAPRELVR